MNTEAFSLPLPYATWAQQMRAFPAFVAGSGPTIEAHGETWELSAQDGFCAVFQRQDETGDHFAISEDEARELGLV